MIKEEIGRVFSRMGMRGRGPSMRGNDRQPRQIVKSANEKHSCPLFLALMIFLIAANLFTINFINRENYLYYWDYVNYWDKVTRLSDHFANNFYSTIKNVVHSVREDDYNDLAAFLLTPFSLLSGRSRLAYILLIVNIFAFAALISFIFLHRKVCRISGFTSPLLPFVSVGVVILSPNFWHDIFYGQVDVGGIVVINVILCLYLNNSFSEQNTRDLLLIALLVPMLVLFRRWYAYWGVSFYSALTIETCFVAFLGYHANKRHLARILLKPIIAIAVSAALFFTAAPTVAIRAITIDRADIYSAYRSSNDIFQSFELVFYYFGLVCFSLFILGAIFSIANKKTRAVTILMLVQWLIIVLLFSRTQDFASHHLYMLLPTTLLFSSLFISRLMLKTGGLKLVVVCAITVLFVLNCLAVFSSKTLWYTKLYPGIFSSIRHPPLVRFDINEIERMLSILTGLLTNPNDRAYVLASSNILNSSILGSAYLSVNRYQDIATKVLTTRDVDKRDGFPQTLLTAKYVVVAYPIQYHLRPEDQRVVGIPAESILTERNIGTSFVRLPYEFNLDNGVRTYIYRNTRSFKESDLDALSERFKSLYPDREYLYKIDKKGLVVR